MGVTGGEQVLWAGGELANGKLALIPAAGSAKNDQGQATAILAAAGSGDKAVGWLVLRGLDRKDHVCLEAAPTEHQHASILWLGGNGRAGDVVLLDSKATNRDAKAAAILLSASSGRTITMNGEDGSPRIHLDGQNANVWVGGNKSHGDIVLFNGDSGDNKTLSQATIHLNGGTGDIILTNADCAEDFDVLDEVEVEPGDVMIVETSGQLRPSSKPYDTRVVGVISGAGDRRPGIVMDKNPTEERRLPVALMGKVFCKADAQYGPIGVGDLLTSSPTPGHAMRAVDSSRTLGAILGKALDRLATGSGLVPILVSLQ